MKILSIVALSLMLFASSVKAQVLEIVRLPKPDFNGMVLNAPGTGTVSLQLVSKTSNKITDKDKWLAKYASEENVARHTDAELQKLTRIEFDGLYRGKVKQLKDYNIIYYGNKDPYGSELYGLDPTLVVVTDPQSCQALYAFDFGNFSVAQFVQEASELEFTKVAVRDVQIQDNVLYAQVGHRTYSKSSAGYNSYLVAIDLNTKSIKWVTKPLTCSRGFHICDGVIFTGYGFTKENDYVYVLDATTGARLHSYKVESSPEYFARKGDMLYVRTYNLDYSFRIIK